MSCPISGRSSRRRNKVREQTGFCADFLYFSYSLFFLIPDARRVFLMNFNAVFFDPVCVASLQVPFNLVSSKDPCDYRLGLKVNY